MADLLWFAHGRSVQCDPALYFPRIPVLDQVARAEPGRVIGYRCLPASLAEMCGLQDVRGYDGIDPSRYTDLLALTAEPGSPELDYARTQWLSPKVEFTANAQIRLSPILDMLGVRYVIFRGTPSAKAHPAFQGEDYWIMQNHAALPRVFVPRRTTLVPDGATQLQKLASSQFDPREVAYVESPVDLPASCQGGATITGETPTQITVSIQMKTPGLVVLADRWATGWRAYLNGRRVAVLRVNHALRGVVVPAGQGTLEFKYEPASFRWGLGLFGFAVTALCLAVTIHSKITLPLTQTLSPSRGSHQ